MPKVPLHDPTERCACATCPGTKTCSASSKRNLPRDCENRWTDGVQPPAINTRSQATDLDDETEPSAASFAERNTRYAQATARAGYHGGWHDLDARCTGCFDGGAIRGGTHIGNGRNRHAGLRKIDRCRVSGVLCREEHDA